MVIQDNGSGDHVTFFWSEGDGINNVNYIGHENQERAEQTYNDWPKLVEEGSILPSGEVFRSSLQNDDKEQCCQIYWSF